MIVLDFQSLYPSITIAYNLCYSTCLGKLKQKFQVKDENSVKKFGCTNLELPLGIIELIGKKNITISPTGVMFVKKNIKLGVLPIILDELLNARKMIKHSMKRYQNEDQKHISHSMNLQQETLKLILNVINGYVAASHSGRMPNSDVTDSVWGFARRTLGKYRFLRFFFLLF